MPGARIVPLFGSVLDFIGKSPTGVQGGMHPEAPTTGDLDAFAAKILAAVSGQRQVFPTASRTRSYVVRERSR
jgi:hypothetical protein